MSGECLGSVYEDPWCGSGSGLPGSGEPPFELEPQSRRSEVSSRRSAPPLPLKVHEDTDGDGVYDTVHEDVDGDGEAHLARGARHFLDAS